MKLNKKIESKMNIEVTTYKDISKKDIKVMKLISNKMTNESLFGFKDHKVILIKVETKVAAFCFISPFSPEQHFANEKEAVYLYNYICDDKYREYKVSKILMDFIKQEYVNLDLNLDVTENNEHAAQFFEKNGFKYMSDYEQSSGQKNKYKAYTYFPIKHVTTEPIL